MLLCRQDLCVTALTHIQKALALLAGAAHTHKVSLIVHWRHDISYDPVFAVSDRVSRLMDVFLISLIVSVKVYIIMFCQTPFLIRPQSRNEKHHSFIGEGVSTTESCA